MTSCSRQRSLTVAARRDHREEVGGGRVTFVKQGTPYRLLAAGDEQECVSIEVWGDNQKLMVINDYNPCKRLWLNELERTEGHGGSNVVWCGDFNAHNTLWGSERIDNNGEVIAELLDEGNLVCFNDGSKTRVDVVTGRESVLDLTMVSNRLTTICDWRVYREGTTGSDHYPVLCTVGLTVTADQGERGVKWIYGKADWEKSEEVSERYLSQVDEDLDIEGMDEEVKQGIIPRCPKK